MISKEDKIKIIRSFETQICPIHYIDLPKLNLLSKSVPEYVLVLEYALKNKLADDKENKNENRVG